MEISFKKLLEWAEHADFLFSWGWRFLIAVGGGTLITAILKVFAGLSGLWLASVLPLASGALLLVLQLLMLKYGVRSIKGTETDISSNPGISVKFLQLRFAPRLDTVPLGMLDEVMALTGRKTYRIDCDLLAEVYLVNEMDTAVTIQGFDARVKIDGAEYPVKEVRDLSDWQLSFERTSTQHGFKNIKTEYVDLESIMAKIGDKPLVKGVGYRGWLRFELLQTDRRSAEKIEFELYIVDAFDKKHGVKTSKEMIEPEGELAYARGLLNRHN